LSVERYETGDGVRYRIRWREKGQKRSETRTSKAEANALDADIKARKYRGEALPASRKDTLASAWDEWQRLVGATLAPTTLRGYQYSWNNHIAGGGYDKHRLIDLITEPVILEELSADMRERDVGPAAQRKTLIVLSAVLSACVRWRRIPSNPVWGMPKPSSKPQRIPHPFPPLVIERIRLRMERRATRDPESPRGRGDACMVSLLSYAGLRPGEAVALTWDDIGSHSLAIDKAVSDGVVGATKTGVARSVPLSRPLDDDLAEWRYASGRPRGSDLVFPGPRGKPWTLTQSNNWRARVWRPTLASLATEDTMERLSAAVPYDCRGSFVSLHLRAGASPLEVARWAGHSPKVMFDHYANVIDELTGEPILPVDAQIARARKAVGDRPKDELDGLVAELFERPTIAKADDDGAAVEFFQPEDNEDEPD
jgi:integrase